MFVLRIKILRSSSRPAARPLPGTAGRQLAAGERGPKELTRASASAASPAQEAPKEYAAAPAEERAPHYAAKWMGISGFLTLCCSFARACQSDSDKTKGVANPSEKNCDDR